MKADKWVDCVIVLSCLIAMIVAFSLSPAPRSPLTQAWLTGYPETAAFGESVDFKLHITGESSYFVTVFVDNRENTRTMASGGDVLSFSISEMPSGKHRISAEIEDIQHGGLHEVFFTVDVV